MHHKQLMMQSNCLAESEIEEGYIVKTVTMLNRRSRRTAQGGDQPGLATGRVRVAPATGLALHARFESD